MNLYKVTSSYDGSRNFADYNVVAENGVMAGAIINTQLNSRLRKVVKKNGEINKAHQQVDEIERIAEDIIIPSSLYSKVGK